MKKRYGSVGATDSNHLKNIWYLCSGESLFDAKDCRSLGSILGVKRRAL